MQTFEWEIPESVEEALSQLGRDPEDSKLLAGGQSLLILMRSRLLRPKRIISLARIDALQGVQIEPSYLRLGAMMTVRAIETHREIQTLCPILPQAAGKVASVHIRHLGTIGGNVCHSLIGADMPPPLLALGAEMEIAGPSGIRTVSVEDFFHGIMETDVQPDEILQAIRVPRLDGQWCSEYRKFAVRAVDPALIGVAVVMRLDAAGVIQIIQIGIGGASEYPVRARATEAALTGLTVGTPQWAEAVKTVQEEVVCIGDAHATEAYRRTMLPVVLAQAITGAVKAG